MSFLRAPFAHPLKSWLVSACALMVAAACSGTADRGRTDPAGRDSTPALAASRPSAAPADTDDFGAPLPIDAQFASRVVSLNPTATEVIFAIGAQSKLVGRSRWDEFPAEAQKVMPLGDGIRPNVEAVLGAKPTLVILYAAAENRAAAEAFKNAGVRTITLRVDHIAQFMSLCTRLGVAMGAPERARNVADSVQHTIDAVRAATRSAKAVRVVWPLWQSPVLVVGRGSYLDELIEIAGGENVFHDMEAPSPPVSIEEIAKRDPNVVVASAKFAATLRASGPWKAVGAMRADHIVLDDPKVTGRPSVVLGMAAVSLARALHPELAGSLP